MVLPTSLPAQHRGNGRGQQRSENNHRQSNQGNNHRGNGNESHRPGGNNIRPGGNSQRPGGNNVRPGGNFGNDKNKNKNKHEVRPVRPDGNAQHRPGQQVRPQQPVRPQRPVRPIAPVRPAAPRPGTGSRPNGWHWSRPVPPRPVRPMRPYGPRPHISLGLGLSYGMMLNAGLNALVNAGLNIVSAVNDAIYLQNVAMAGITWPYATLYYNNGLMSGARYQYMGARNSLTTFNRAYTQLCNMYGAPASTDFTGVSRIATWWGGGDTGYITLSYQPAYDDYGAMQYCTDLVYGQ